MTGSTLEDSAPVDRPAHRSIDAQADSAPGRFEGVEAFKEVANALVAQWHMDASPTVRTFNPTAGGRSPSPFVNLANGTQNKELGMSKPPQKQGEPSLTQMSAADAFPSVARMAKAGKRNGVSPPGGRLTTGDFGENLNLTPGKTVGESPSVSAAEALAFATRAASAVTKAPVSPPHGSNDRARVDTTGADISAGEPEKQSVVAPTRSEDRAEKDLKPTVSPRNHGLKKLSKPREVPGSPFLAHPVGGEFGQEKNGLPPVSAADVAAFATRAASAVLRDPVVSPQGQMTTESSTAKVERGNAQMMNSLKVPPPVGNQPKQEGLGPFESSVVDVAASASHPTHIANEDQVSPRRWSEVVETTERGADQDRIQGSNSGGKPSVNRAVSESRLTSGSVESREVDVTKKTLPGKLNDPWHVPGGPSEVTHGQLEKLPTGVHSAKEQTVFSEDGSLEAFVRNQAVAAIPHAAVTAGTVSGDTGEPWSMEKPTQPKRTPEAAAEAETQSPQRGAGPWGGFEVSAAAKGQTGAKTHVPLEVSLGQKNHGAAHQATEVVAAQHRKRRVDQPPVSIPFQETTVEVGGSRVASVPPVAGSSSRAGVPFLKNSSGTGRPVGHGSNPGLSDKPTGRNHVKSPDPLRPHGGVAAARWDAPVERSGSPSAVIGGTEGNHAGRGREGDKAFFPQVRELRPKAPSSHGEAAARSVDAGLQTLHDGALAESSYGALSSADVAEVDVKISQESVSAHDLSRTKEKGKNHDTGSPVPFMSHGGSSPRVRSGSPVGGDAFSSKGVGGRVALEGRKGGVDRTSATLTQEQQSQTSGSAFRAVVGSAGGLQTRRGGAFPESSARGSPPANAVETSARRDRSVERGLVNSSFLRDAKEQKPERGVAATSAGKNPQRPLPYVEKPPAEGGPKSMPISRNRQVSAALDESVKRQSEVRSHPAGLQVSDRESHRGAVAAASKPSPTQAQPGLVKAGKPAKSQVNAPSPEVVLTESRRDTTFPTSVGEKRPRQSQSGAELSPGGSALAAAHPAADVNFGRHKIRVSYGAAPQASGLAGNHRTLDAVVVRGGHSLDGDYWEIPVEGLGTGIVHILGDMVGGVVDMSRMVTGGAKALGAKVSGGSAHGPSHRGTAITQPDPKPSMFVVGREQHAVSIKAMVGQVSEGFRGMFIGVGQVARGGTHVVVGTLGCLGGALFFISSSVTGALLGNNQTSVPKLRGEQNREFQQTIGL